VEVTNPSATQTSSAELQSSISTAASGVRAANVRAVVPDLVDLKVAVAHVLVGTREER
jgi:hypothetical protein